MGISKFIKLKSSKQDASAGSSSSRVTVSKSDDASSGSTSLLSPGEPRRGLTAQLSTHARQPRSPSEALLSPPPLLLPSAAPGSSPASQSAAPEVSDAPPEDFEAPAATIEAFNSPSKASADSTGIWGEALEKVNEKTKEWMKARGIEIKGNLSAESAKGEVDEIMKMIQNGELEEQEEPWTWTIRGRKMIPRDLIQTWIPDIVNNLILIADAGVPKAAVGIVKAVLQIPVKYFEQMAAITGTVCWFTRIVRRGQLYERLFTAENVGEGPFSSLHETLLDLYVAALQLLALSERIFHSRFFRRTLRAILRPSQAKGEVLGLYKKEERVTLEAGACHACLSNRSSGRLMEGVDLLQDRLDELESQSSWMGDVVESWVEKLDRQENEAMLDFISSEKFGKTHAFTSDARIPGTGDWLVENENFLRWQDADSGSAVLCLQGTIGVGKTFLTSRVVDHVKEEMRRTQDYEGFAHFYCTRTTSSFQDPLVVLRSLVRQLCMEAHYFEDHSGLEGAEVLKVVKQRCDQAKREGRDLSMRDCKDLILGSINLYLKTTIILDALDESNTLSHNLAEILIDIKNKSAQPVKIFISTRPDREYMKVFEPESTITVDASAQQGDIEKYLEETLYRTPYFQTMSPRIQEMVKGTFRKQNGGMFRWVELQSKLVRKRRSEEAIINWAQSVPKGLVEAYNAMWDCIERDHEQFDVDLAKRAISWVLASPWALKVEFLLTAVSRTVKGLRAESQDRPTAKLILDLCQDFLTIDTARGVWMVPHASVTEYFNSKHSRIGNCYKNVCAAMLGFLSDLDAESEFTIGLDIHRYIDGNWLWYLQQYENALSLEEDPVVDREFAEALMLFLGSPEGGSRSYRAWNQRDSPDELKPPVLLMRESSVYHVVLDWWMSDEIRQQMDAAWIHQPQDIEISHLLRPSGVDDPLVGDYDFLLFSALAHNQPDDALRIMRDFAKRFPLCQIGPHCWLYFAKYPRKLQWFLEHAGTWPATTPTEATMSILLLSAAAADSLRSVDILIRFGADVNMSRDRDSQGRQTTMLQTAAMNGRRQLLELLLEAGADPNLVHSSGKGESALSDALTVPHLLDSDSLLRPDMQAIVAKLLEVKADPNQSLDSELWGSPLEALAQNIVWQNPRDLSEHSEMIDVMLNAGADAARVYDGGRYGSALVVLVMHGRLALVKQLVARIGKDAALQTLRGRRFPNGLQPLYDMEHLSLDLEETREYLKEEIGLDETRDELLRFMCTSIHERDPAQSSQ